MGARRVLLVSDPGIVAVGHSGRARELLAEAGREVFLYGQVVENPTESSVEACADFAREVAPDLIVGLGGGSSLDTAKGCLFLLSGGGRMADYQGHDKARGEMLPFIAIPTTAGTGSECQSYAVLCRDDSHEKMACGDARALARVAILDPELTATMPLRVARLTSLDALSHLLEAAVTTKRNETSASLVQAAARAVFPVIEAVVRGEADLAQRQAMLEGAALAGRAIEASMLGAAHASANPLSASYGLAHGEAVLRTLPAVMRWNLGTPGVRAIYEGLLPGIFPQAEALIERVEELRAMADFQPLTLPADDIPRLAAAVARQWTGQFNPRPLTESDFARLYTDISSS
ncbi:MAG: iron-containing alcohol dehydrogenase [Verrucomicrobiales bacterium]